MEYFEKIHHNGNLWVKGHMLDGKLHGKIEIYFDNGQKEKEIDYQNGLKHGVEKIFLRNEKEDGLEYWFFYEKGEFIGKKQNRYVQQGVKIMVVEYNWVPITDVTYLKNFKSSYFSKQEWKQERFTINLKS